MPAEETMTPPVELLADKYRLTRLLGKGGMGAVWEGVHATLGTRVAVKFIDAEYASSEDVRARFVNEAKAAARLRSKHVVQVYDQGVLEDGRPYIVMEFLAGEPLDQRLDRLGRLSLADTALIMLQVGRALTKAHASGIVHRDLKPENIFLVWDEEDRMDVAKVVDFGIAKFTETGPGASSSSTRTGAVLGTPQFMSPEQARGLRSIDHRTDLWSLGVIAYRCVVGTLPYEGEAIGDLLVKICTTDAPPPSERAADVPPGLDEWMSRALAREPEQRFQSASELIESLCRLAGVEARLAPLSTLSDGAQPHTESAVARTDPESATAAPLTQDVPAARGKTHLYVGLGVGLAAMGAVVLGMGAFGGAPPAEVSEESASPARAGHEPPRRVEPVVSPARAKPGPSSESLGEQEQAEGPAEPQSDEAPEKARPPARRQPAARRPNQPAARRPKTVSKRADVPAESKLPPQKAEPSPSAAPEPPPPAAPEPEDLLGY